VTDVEVPRYRKALRMMRHANHFGFPIITFIDTPGAYAGVQAEELGQVRASSRLCCPFRAGHGQNAVYKIQNPELRI